MSRRSLFHLFWEQGTEASWRKRYAIAILTGLVAALLRIALNRAWGENFPFVLYFPVTLSIALFAGFGPALACITVMTVITTAWVLPPLSAPMMRGPIALTGLIAFVVVAALIAWLAARHRQVLIERQQTERELARRQRVLFDLVEGCPFGIYIVDSELRIATMNKGSQEGAFVNVRPVIGRAFEEAVRILWPEPVARDVVSHFRHTLHSGEPFYSRDFVHQRSDIEQVQGYEWELHRITLPDGRFGVICYYFDSTKLRQAEQALRDSRQRYRDFVSNSTEGVYRLEFTPPIDTSLPPEAQIDRVYEAGKLAECNDAFAKMYGFERGEELIGTSLAMMMPPEDPDVREYLRMVIDAGYRVSDVESAERDRNGNPNFFANSIIGVVENGHLVRCWGIQRDITERKAYDENLRRAKEAAESANIAKDNFLATLSHELRTPLTPVVATLSSWESLRSFPPELAEELATVRRNVDLEARLIDDLLDLTRIVRGKIKLNMEIVDVHRLLNDVVAMYTSDVRAKRISLSLHLDAQQSFVRGDSGRLQQALWNVLKNAVKFTGENGKIEIRTHDANDERIEISIADTGIGISPEMVQRLFQPFEQESAAQYGGLGLGLTITRTLLEAQGGSIGARSAGVGQGATFVISLPYVEKSLHSAPLVGSIAPRTGDGEATKCYRVLLVEDHQDTARVLARLLRGIGHEVNTVHTVADAVCAVQKTDFDVLVSDIGLPDGTGIDLIRQIREQYGSRLPAIALTGFGMEEDVLRTKQAGFDEHLSKPVNLMLLEETIQRACREGGGALASR
jgi:PAS domain S-box-containing protein